MTSTIDTEQQNTDELNKLQEQQGQKIKSKILSKLFKEVNEEKTFPNAKVDPKAQYVRGGHTSGVYHKHYNRAR